MHFIDPEELGGPHVIGRKEEANLFRHYGVGYAAAGPSAGRGAAPDAHTRGVGPTMLHEHAVPSANQMS